jgi:hypothetical protein
MKYVQFKAMISLYPLLLSKVNGERVNHNWKFKYDGFIYTTVWCDVIARVNMENYCQNTGLIGQDKVE